MLERIILALFGPEILRVVFDFDATVRRGPALFPDLNCFRFFDFTFTVFGFAELFREPAEAADREPLRGADFLLALLFVVWVFFLLAIFKVYHCHAAQSSPWPGVSPS
jgi:hypothetical protein